VRRLYTTQELRRRGMTFAAIQWAVKKGRLTRVTTSVYAEGRARPSALDEAVAIVLATHGVAGGTLAGVLLGFDGVKLERPDVTVAASASARRAGARRRRLPPERIVTVAGIRCTDALQTLIDLAALVDDARWEQALESALRGRMTALGDVASAAAGSQRGAVRMRRVLALRPKGAPPTESLLETRLVQLARRVPGLPPPERQFSVRAQDGRVVARVDLAWPDLGLFVELDGQFHTGQPVHDARRETLIVAMTGWLCGRFTWDDAINRPATTTGRLALLADRARHRPVAG